MPAIRYFRSCIAMKRRAFDVLKLARLVDEKHSLMRFVDRAWNDPQVRLGAHLLVPPYGSCRASRAIRSRSRRSRPRKSCGERNYALRGFWRFSSQAFPAFLVENADALAVPLVDNGFLLPVVRRAHGVHALELRTRVGQVLSQNASDDHVAALSELQPAHARSEACSTCRIASSGSPGVRQRKRELPKRKLILPRASSSNFLFSSSLRECSRLPPKAFRRFRFCKTLLPQSA